MPAWTERLKSLYRWVPRPVRAVLALLGAAVRHWASSQSFIYAAALAFFTVFSIAPFVIVVVAMVGIVLGERAAEGELMEQLQGVLGPEAAQFVQTAVMNSRLEESGLWPTVLGVLAILAGATTVFGQMQKSLNEIWDVAPARARSGVVRLLKTRLLSLATVLVIGFVLLVSLLLSVALRSAMTYAEQWLPLPGWVMVGAEYAVSLAVSTGLFAAIFRILPDVALRWRDVFAGAFVTAILFTLGRSLIAMYLATTAMASTYGAAGSLVMLLLWVNYSALILLFGASVTRVGYEATGREIVPRNGAVRVSRVPVPEPAATEPAATEPAPTEPAGRPGA